jgi:hypothetical protein
MTNSVYLRQGTTMQIATAQNYPHTVLKLSFRLKTDAKCNVCIILSHASRLKYIKLSCYHSYTSLL